MQMFLYPGLFVSFSQEAALPTAYILYLMYISYMTAIYDRKKGALHFATRPKTIQTSRSYGCRGNIIVPTDSIVDFVCFATDPFISVATYF